MKTIVKMAFALLLLVLVNQATTAQDKERQCPTPEVAKDTKFVPGQVWEYKTRKNEESSTLTILKVESLGKLGMIIHIRVDKIRLRNCTGGPEPDKFEHMPFSREAIERSTTKLLRQSKVPNFQEGYDEWLKDCGGVYTIPVAEAVQASEEVFRKNVGCEPKA